MILQANIAQLLEHTDSSDVQNVLSDCDPYTNIHATLEKLNAFSKPQLEDTINFLKSVADYQSAVTKIKIKQKNKTKKDLTFEIYKFICEICPVQCKKCEDEYIPVEQESNANNVCCIICDRTAHDLCYTKETIDELVGIVYLCPTCAEYIKSSQLNKPVELTNLLAETNNKEIQSQPIDEFTEDIVIDESGIATQTVDESGIATQTESYSQSQWFSPNRISKREDHPTQGNGLNDEQEECKLLSDGICPFGISGKGCEFKHKKRCTRYCSYGNGRWGCKWGQDCRKLHPKLCENSEKLKICLSIECKKVHLKGTKRTVSKERELDDGRQENNYKISDRYYNRNDRQRNTEQHNMHNANDNYMRNRAYQVPINYTDNKPFRREEQVRNHTDQKQRREEQVRGSKMDEREKLQEGENENQLPSKETTMTFLAKCLEGVKKDLSKEIQQQVNELYQNLENVRQKQIQSVPQVFPPMQSQQYIPFIPQQMQQERPKFNYQLQTVPTNMYQQLVPQC